MMPEASGWGPGGGVITHHRGNSYCILGAWGLAHLPLTLNQEARHHSCPGKLRGELGFPSSPLRARMGEDRWAVRTLQDFLQEL